MGTGTGKWVYVLYVMRELYMYVCYVCMCYVWKIKINLDIYQFPPTEDREIDRYMQQLIDDDER